MSLLPEDPRSDSAMNLILRTPTRILLLEDNIADARLCMKKLRDNGFELLDCDIVSAQQEFIDRVRAETYDIVLADYRMPSWTGREALRWLRTSGYKMPFILITGALGDELAVECLKDGATDYMLKDKLDRLPSAVQRALNERQLELDRDRAENRLRESERQYHLLFDTSPTPMWVFDREDLRFLAVNMAACQQYGYTREEFLSTSLTDIRPQAQPDLESGNYPERSRPGEGSSYALRHLKKDGSVIDVEVNYRDLMFGGRKARLLLASDITARLVAKESLIRSEAECHSIMEGMPNGVCHVTQNGRLLLVNPALASLLGYRSEYEAYRLNEETDLWCDPEERQNVIAIVDRQGTVTSYQTTWKGKNAKPITVRIGGKRLLDESGETDLYEFCVQDLAGEVRIRQPLLASQKLQVIGWVVPPVPHELQAVAVSSGTESLQAVEVDPAKALPAA